MDLIQSLEDLQTKHQHAIITIGNFDGVHRGHQLMVQDIVTQAKALNVPSLVMLFEPQPMEFFSENPPARITTLTEKCDVLSKLGLDAVLCLPFDEDFAEKPAEAFVKDILVDKLKVKHVLIGDDFRFGHKRTGDFALLKTLGEQYGFTTVSLASIIENNARISSTQVREALKQGDFDRAQALLGRPYVMKGQVIKGDQRGRLLGFPTANIAPARKTLPMSGVFAVKVHGLAGGPKFGMANLGTRPTLDGKRTLLEINIYDFDQDIYGQTIEVEFCQKIRDEQRFDSVDALRTQITQDKVAVEDYFQHG